MGAETLLSVSAARIRFPARKGERNMLSTIEFECLLKFISEWVNAAKNMVMCIGGDSRILWGR